MQKEVKTLGTDKNVMYAHKNTHEFNKFKLEHVVEIYEALHGQPRTESERSSVSKEGDRL